MKRVAFEDALDSRHAKLTPTIIVSCIARIPPAEIGVIRDWGAIATSAQLRGAAPVPIHKERDALLDGEARGVPEHTAGP